MIAGQVARMGAHTLACADCLDWLPSIPDGSVDMVFADLPYGVTRNKWDTCIPLAPLWEQLLRVGKPRCAFVFTATQPFATSLICSQRKLFRYDLVWHKIRSTGFLNANSQPLRQHEIVLLFYRKKPAYTPQFTPGKTWRKFSKSKKIGTGYGKHTKTAASGGEMRFPASIVRPDSADLVRGAFGAKNLCHPTQKPVALLEWLIKTYSNPGDTVLDPTAGSGTAIVACETTGRVACACEMDPGYCAIALERIAKHLDKAKEAP